MVLGKKKKDRGDWSWNMTPEAYEAIKKLHEHDKRATIKRPTMCLNLKLCTKTYLTKH